MFSFCNCSDDVPLNIIILIYFDFFALSVLENFHLHYQDLGTLVFVGFLVPL